MLPTSPLSAPSWSLRSAVRFLRVLSNGLAGSACHMLTDICSLSYPGDRWVAFPYGRPGRHPQALVGRSWALLVLFCLAGLCCVQGSICKRCRNVSVARRDYVSALTALCVVFFCFVCLFSGIQCTLLDGRSEPFLWNVYFAHFLE